MLPDLGDDSPTLKADEAMTLAEFEAGDLAGVVVARRRRLIANGSADGDRTLEDSPDLAASAVILPGQALPWGDQEQLGAERQLLAEVL